MTSFPFLYFSFLVVIFFNTFPWINAGRNCKCSDDLTNDLNLGNLPPRSGEQGSQVPANWQWKSVLVDDLSSDNGHIRNQAKNLFQQNTLYSILCHQENEARNKYESKEQEHIRNKQIQYNENMKQQWQKDRMHSLPSKCKISRR